MTKKIGLILLNLAVLAIGIGYPYLETRLSGQIAATFNSRLLGIATAVKAAFYVLLLAEGLLAMHLTLGLRRGAGARFVPIVKAVRLLAAAAAVAVSAAVAAVAASAVGAERKRRANRFICDADEPVLSFRMRRHGGCARHSALPLARLASYFSSDLLKKFQLFLLDKWKRT